MLYAFEATSCLSVSGNLAVYTTEVAIIKNYVERLFEMHMHARAHTHTHAIPFVLIVFQPLLGAILLHSLCCNTHTRISPRDWEKMRNVVSYSTQSSHASSSIYIYELVH